MASSNPPKPLQGLHRRDSASTIGLAVAFLIGLYLLLTSTTNLIPTVEQYDAKRIIQFGLLFGLTLPPLASGTIRTRLTGLIAGTPRWLRALIAFFFSWGALSALVRAESWLHAANSLADVALLALLTYGIYSVAACRQEAGERFDRVAVALLVLSSIAIGFQELTGVLAAHQAGVDFNYWLSLAYFAHPRFFNQVQTWAIPVLAALPLLFPRSRLTAPLCLLALGLNWFIVLMTGARGSFIGITIAVIGVAYFVPVVRTHLLKWQITGLVAGAVVFALVTLSFEPAAGAVATNTVESPPANPDSRTLENLQYIGDLPDHGNRFLGNSLGRPLLHAMGRAEMWQRATDDALANPLLGIGPMAYPCTESVAFGHPHSLPLQIAAEWGIPAAVALGLLIATLLWRTCITLRRNQGESPRDQRIAALLFAGTVAATLHACVSGVLVMPASQVVGLLICGMLLGRHQAARTQKSGLPAVWPFLPLMLLSLALLALGAYELTTMQQRTDSMPPGIKHPRMWQDSVVCRTHLP